MRDDNLWMTSPCWSLLESNNQGMCSSLEHQLAYHEKAASGAFRGGLAKPAELGDLGHIYDTSLGHVLCTIWTFKSNFGLKAGFFSLLLQWFQDKWAHDFKLQTLASVTRDPSQPLGTTVLWKEAHCIYHLCTNLGRSFTCASEKWA